MAEEKIYKQVPVVQVSDNVVCPICEKKGTFDTKMCKIMLRKSKTKTRVFSERLHYCYDCDIPYVTPQMCKVINRQNRGYKLSTFQPINSATKDDVLKTILSDVCPQEEINEKVLSNSTKKIKAENDYHSKQKKTKKITSNKENRIKIGDTDFDLYPVSKCNVKILPKKVYTIPVGFTHCPLCGRTLLRDYVYAVQINDKSCIKSNGCMCIRCNAFFTISQKLFFQLEELRIDKEAYQLKSDYCNSYNYKKYSSFFNDLKSVYKQITVCGNNDIRTYTIVYDSWEVNELENVIYYTSEVAVKLLIADRDKATVDIESKSFRIVKVREKNIDIAQKREIDNVILHKKYFNGEIPELSSQNTLYIYGGKIACHHKHSIVEFRAYIDDFDGGESSFFVEYCYDCDKFLMRYDDYSQYLHRYHFFPLKLEMLGVAYDDYHRAEQSPLMVHGYTVNSKDDFSARERQRKLQKIIDNGVLEKRQVLDYLEMFIRESKYNPRRQNAISKWKEDKDFVLSYTSKRTPEVRIWRIQRRK